MKSAKRSLELGHARALHDPARLERRLSAASSSSPNTGLVIGISIAWVRSAAVRVCIARSTALAALLQRRPLVATPPLHDGAQTFVQRQLGAEPEQLLSQLGAAHAVGHEHLRVGPVVGLEIGPGLASAATRPTR